MSAREIISRALDSAYGPEHAQDIINDLIAAGYRILGPDELDPVTVERTLDAAGDYMGTQYGNTALHHPTDRARIIRALPTGGDR